MTVYVNEQRLASPSSVVINCAKTVQLAYSFWWH